MVAFEATKEVVWLRKFILDLHVMPSADWPITLYCDNSGIVAQSKELESHKRQKHILRKYHLIRDFIDRGNTMVTKIASEDNLAGPFTKSFPECVFEIHVNCMSLRSFSGLL